ncbi:MAG: DUF3291 domain-containing protein [Gammaproteobacteria bacterium]|nr:DUF3291 domain-containing protein [Gammaproteobacteria bacterium]NNC97454.1 DUF3291 domain-containing protein [Gammaproteobacteria bacterium]NNM12981.1 DUF3291 domain-containing protein [Gammaproteobacteria bacterium]
MTSFHLAQINIAHAKADMESSLMQGFVERLDEINALADQSPGFVWRLQDDEGNATSIQAFSDPKVIVNLSVWENIDALKTFVYQTAHLELLQNKQSWFDHAFEAHLALWWVPVGHIPDLTEGKNRLRLLQQLGPGSGAFSFAKPFAPPGLS